MLRKIGFRWCYSDIHWLFFSAIDFSRRQFLAAERSLAIVCYIRSFWFRHPVCHGFFVWRMSTLASIKSSKSAEVKNIKQFCRRKNVINWISFGWWSFLLNFAQPGPEPVFSRGLKCFTNSLLQKQLFKKCTCSKRFWLSFLRAWQKGSAVALSLV